MRQNGKERMTAVLCAVMLLGSALLAGCGKGGEESALKLGETVEVKDYAEMTLKEVSSGDTVSSPKSGGLSMGYSCSDEGMTYLKLVMKVKNLSASDLPVDEFAKIVIRSGDAEYSADLFVLLTEDDSQLERGGALKPLASGTVYGCAKVPEESLGDAVITFQIQDQAFQFSCDTSKTTAKYPELKLGQTLEAEDYGELTLAEVCRRPDVTPSNPGMFYTHYEVKNQDNTYLDVAVDLKNLRSSEYEASQFFGVSAVYQDKYVYPGMVTMEESDGSDFNPYGSIDPLGSAWAHGLIELPKEALNSADGSCIIYLYFHGDQYVLTDVEIKDGGSAPAKAEKPSEPEKTPAASGVTVSETKMSYLGLTAQQLDEKFGPLSYLGTADGGNIFQAAGSSDSFAFSAESGIVEDRVELLGMNQICTGVYCDNSQILLGMPSSISVDQLQEILGAYGVRAEYDSNDGEGTSGMFFKIHGKMVCLDSDGKTVEASRKALILSSD